VTFFSTHRLQRVGCAHGLLFPFFSMARQRGRRRVVDANESTNLARDSISAPFLFRGVSGEVRSNMKLTFFLSLSFFPVLGSEPLRTSPGAGSQSLDLQSFLFFFTWGRWPGYDGAPFSVRPQESFGVLASDNLPAFTPLHFFLTDPRAAARRPACLSDSPGCSQEDEHRRPPLFSPLLVLWLPTRRE